jgi:hypothetical protein
VPDPLLGEEQARLEAIERRLVPRHASHDRVHVEPAGHRLPGLDLVERRTVGVQLQDDLGERLQHDGVERRRGAQSLEGRRRESHRVVEVSALEAREPGRALAS